MKKTLSRRAIVKTGLLAGLSVPVLGLTTPEARAAAAGLTPLDPSDPLAKSLNFTTDASKVDASANPTYKPTQKCANCAQYQGKAGEATAACTIFAGHTVPQGGWCKVWAQKPGVK
jgi:High potential iron-sulfur protein